MKKSKKENKIAQYLMQLKGGGRLVVHYENDWQDVEELAKN